MIELHSENPVVLITGASTGIGKCLTNILINKNYRLVLTAREKSLHRFKENNIFENEKIMIRHLDVCSSEQRRALINEINEKWNGVDILINNAGISYRAVIEHMSDKEELHQLGTNYLGALSLIRKVLPKMREKGFGHIINVSSVSGMMAMPTMASYSASKFALEGASESLWYEMKPWNIKVSLIQPGFINSEAFKNVYYSDLSQKSFELQNETYSLYYKYMSVFVEKLMRHSPSHAEHVAKKIFKIMKRKNPPLRVPATWDARFFYMLRRLLPRRVYHQILYWGLPGISHWGDTKKSAKQHF